MKATELRIGNLVKGKEINVYWTVEAIDSNSIFSYAKWRPLDAFEPIPLTEDFLLKFGFEDNQIRNNGLYLRVEFHLETIIFWAGIEDEDLTIESEIPLAYIHHVHQLQNLYHALTGEELTLKNQEK
jgi:hypothetical protein